MTETLALTTRLLAFLGLVQSLEFLRLRAVYQDDGIWRWQDLAGEVAPGGWHNILGWALAENNFRWLNYFRLALAIGLLVVPNGPGVAVLFLLHLLTLLRWRGTFNGGSDAMNLLVLSATAVAWTFRGQALVVHGCLLYISLQVCCSYAKAGWLKLKNPEWWDGRALRAFAQASMYQPTRLIRAWTARPWALVTSSWLVIVFELSFPFSLTSGSAAAVYLILGAGFHLANIYIFGLNRFFWAWLCAYPALIFVANGH